jgi:Fe2+ transport protein
MSSSVEQTGPGGSDWHQNRKGGLIIAGAAAAVVLLVILVNVTHSNPAAASASGMASSGMATTSASTTTSGMAGTNATPAIKGIPTVNGATLPVMATTAAMPVAMSMVPLGQANWDGMKIEARTSAPAKFELFNGTSQQLVSPTKTTSFHLMILLSDASTGVAIPYSSVWATISKAGKIVFDERLWPMISRYMGPHYGNNVSLPGAGTYHLTLLVSPPAAARHLEYKNLWLQPHRVHLTFRWVPKV